MQYFEFTVFQYTFSHLIISGTGKKTLIFKLFYCFEKLIFKNSLPLHSVQVNGFLLLPNKFMFNPNSAKNAPDSPSIKERKNNE